MEDQEAQELGGSEQEVEEQAPEEESGPSETRQESNELKVVLVLKGNRAMIGVQSPDCDPIFTTLEGDLAAALSHVPALVASASAKWDSNPRNPKADLPEPAPSTTPARTSVAPQSAKQKSQPSFF